jgi:hypothetical protein
MEDRKRESLTFDKGPAPVHPREAVAEESCACARKAAAEEVFACLGEAVAEPCACTGEVAAEEVFACPGEAAAEELNSCAREAARGRLQSAGHRHGAAGMGFRVQTCTWALGPNNQVGPYPYPKPAYTYGYSYLRVEVFDLKYCGRIDGNKSLYLVFVGVVFLSILDCF